MSTLDVINSIVVTLGIPTTIGALIYIGRKLQVLDTVEHEIDQNVRPDLKDLQTRLSQLEGKTDNMFKANSPVKLTPKGAKALEESGLKDFIDENTDQLLEACEVNDSFTTPYDVQESVFSFFDAFDFPEDVENKLKNYAFNQGTSMDVMRRVGALYFRDICLSKNNFKAEDLDR